MKLSPFTIRTEDGEIVFQFRAESAGDRGVINQMFQQQDYNLDMFAQGKALLEYYNNKINNRQKALIIDAGANIGASAVYFSLLYKQSFIYAIEPEKNNCSLLKLNLKSLDAEIFEGAIGCENGFMFLHDPGLSDWGFRVGKNGSIQVPVISPNTILKNMENRNLFPFIFKIDIEGGEGELFRANLDWIDKFPLIVIELHDWMLPFQGTSRNFIKAIGAYDFDFLYRGENIFCFNRRILRKSA
jgi:FkbM family methyltransferase